MGAYTLLQDLTVATNSTSVVLNDFGTITKDDFVKVVFFHTNSSIAVNCFLTANNTISTDYHSQQLRGNGTAVTADRINSSRVNRNSANGNATTFMYLKLSENDRLNIFTNSTDDMTSSNLFLNFFYITSSGATFTSGITSLTFTASQTNSFVAGTRIQIYRLDAVKVADITVASNTTQVDISSLSIDKDSEYLLVSDIVGASAGFMYLYPNDLTTPTNYYAQQIIGAGSSTGASRDNLAQMTYIDGSSIRNIVHSHIKLSNIGAYTSQNYAIRQVGQSSLILTNTFISSTAENITSITKLNIVASATNGIAAGSRFTLYKLYE